MKSLMKTIALTCALAVALFASSAFAQPAPANGQGGGQGQGQGAGMRGKRAGNERHPHIRAAIRELEQAKRELQEAAHDFGGHRAEALKACDEAINQLRQALQYDKK